MSSLNNSDYAIDERIYAMSVAELINVLKVKMKELENIVCSKGINEQLTNSQIFEFHARQQEIMIAASLLRQKNTNLPVTATYDPSIGTFQGINIADFLRSASVAYLPPKPLTDEDIKKAAQVAVAITKHPMFGKFPKMPEYAWSKKEEKEPKPVVEDSKLRKRHKRKIVYEDT